jgi:hypothetical protein
MDVAKRLWLQAHPRQGSSRCPFAEGLGLLRRPAVETRRSLARETDRSIDREIIEGRYRWIDSHADRFLKSGAAVVSLTDRIDRIILNPFIGFALFLVRRYEARFSETPGFFAAFSYDGARLLIEVVEQVGLNRARVRDELAVYQNITEGNDLIRYGNATLDARAYVSRFNFRGGEQQKKVGECSGGMRNRVLLARMLREGGNLILLDEPTNDLDLDTLRVLENAIDHFPGSAIVVSHDRWFLNRLVSHILAFEGDGYVNFHHGTFESYVEWREEWRERMNFPPESRAGRYRKLIR